MMTREWFVLELLSAWPSLASSFFFVLSPLLLAVGVVFPMPLLFPRSAIKGTTIRSMDVINQSMQPKQTHQEIIQWLSRQSKQKQKNSMANKCNKS